MNRAPFSDEERRQQADRAAMEALNQLQGGPGDHQPLASPAHVGFDSLSQAAEIEEAHPRIHPLLILLDFVIAFGLTAILQIPLVLFMLGTRSDLQDLWRNGNGEALQQALNTPGFFAIATLTQALVFLLVVIVRIVVLNRRGWRWLGIWPGAFSLSALGWGVLGGVLFLTVNVIFGLISQGLGLQLPDQARIFPTEGASLAGLLAIGFGVVVLAPVSEELFFRAYSQQIFVERYGVIPGILIGALLFTLPHLLTITQGFLVLLAAVFAGGVILGWIYWRTRSIGAAIIAHAINNAAAFLSILVAPELEGLR